MERREALDAEFFGDFAAEVEVRRVLLRPKNAEKGNRPAKDKVRLYILLLP